MILCTAEEWQAYEGRFVALWTDAQHAYALYQPGTLLAVPLAEGAYPALKHPGASWFQRLAHDMTGAIATGAADTRPAIEQFRAPDGTAPWPDFAAPEGEGAHVVSVGPVHAAIIEPGHFRFTLRGEQVLKLQSRFGYAHKGTLALMRGKSPRLAARFAARISGDATVAHSLAYAQAAEAALAFAPPRRAVHLRAVMAEIERLANHASDIGAIAGDVGFAFLDSRFAWHRESFCAAAYAAFGHRLMMDIVVPGGVASDLRPKGEAAILSSLDALETELPSLIRVFEDYASLQDRLIGTGIIPVELASAYAAGGYVGRASGQNADSRLTPGYAPYEKFGLVVPVEQEGDVAARIRIRLAEITESIRLVRALLAGLPDDGLTVAPPAGSGSGIGVAESFRGPVWTWLRLDNGVIADLFIADPSTLHWPLLEHAVTTSIFADFPVINKSVNGSYSGVDL
ncbi:MAG TPA: hydrogenase expression protein HypE [Acidocella sp.]|jgi:Ni,Fe-hydrogenase III large subunit|uniref:hydrogenase large subunit n=1 Tax=Acidocella sp. TaxID=50710 RepID=UPI002B56BCC9|nr:hydrogenase expression protein HypE [Acidocella sp.]HVE22660.1 hydrogenase expression protein HypE [Acidocella sp.]